MKRLSKYETKIFICISHVSKKDRYYLNFLVVN